MKSTTKVSTARPLRSEAEYDAAVEELNRLLDSQPKAGSAADARLEQLTLLVGDYDEQHYPMPEEIDPPATVQFVLEQHGKTRADLIPLLGSKSRVSEFLNGKRRLSMTQVSALRQAFSIPADLLIERNEESHSNRPYAFKRAKVSRVSEDAPRYTVSKPHHVSEEATKLLEVLEAVEVALEANTKVMAALLAALKRRER